MKNNRTIIATCIVAIFASSPALAKDSWQFHEDDWSKVRSYAKVSISQDSVESWGAWTDFVEPAAGAPSPIAMPGLNGSDSYRNNPSVAVVMSDVCATGDWCGYAIFSDSTKTSGAERKSGYGHGNEKQSFSAGLFALTLTPDSSEITAGDGAGSGSSSWSLKSLGATDPNFANSGGDLETTFGGGTYNPEYGHWSYKWVKVSKFQWELVKDKWIVDAAAGSIYDNRDSGLHHISATGNDSTLTAFSHNVNSNEASSNSSGIGLGEFEKAITGQKYNRGSNRHPDYVWVLPDEQVAVGKFERESVESYTSGEGKSSSTTTTTMTTTGYYVAGVATPQAYLDAQRAGNVSASYIGGSFDGNQQGKVQITVNFQPGTWTGNWSENSSFNFNAAGTVSGANIAGNVVDSKNLQGTVNGTFYGQAAGSIGGVSSVQNMKTEVTQNAIFLVNKIPTTLPKP